MLYSVFGVLLPFCGAAAFTFLYLFLQRKRFVDLNFKIIILFVMIVAFSVYITYNAVLVMFPHITVPVARRRHLENEIAYLARIFGPPRSDFKPGFAFVLASLLNIKPNFVLMGLAYRIFEHMQVDAASVELDIIRVNSSRFDDSSYISGTFESDGGAQSIKIFARRDYSLQEIASVMCHECTHFFMYSHMLSELEGGFNENLTDIAAVFLGFSSIMLKGYDEKIRRVKTYDGILVSTSKLGYISKSDILYIRKIIRKLRK